MQGGAKPLGYTIVEVMIVMAISGMMFVMASTFINGKQATTAFNTGSHELGARLQDTIDQVVDGQYTDIPVRCTFSPASGPVFDPPVSATDNSQGTNSECVFLGKLIHFSYRGDSTRYETMSLAGGRVDASGQPITSLASSRPAVVTTPTTTLTTVSPIPQSLELRGILVYEGSTPVTPVYAIGFLQGLGTPGADSSQPLKNGAQTTALYYLRGTTASQDEGDINTLVKSNNLARADKAIMCISDGGRYAWLTLGYLTSQLNIDVQLLGNLNSPNNLQKTVCHIP